MFLELTCLAIHFHFFSIHIQKIIWNILQVFFKKAAHEPDIMVYDWLVISGIPYNQNLISMFPTKSLQEMDIGMDALMDGWSQFLTR